MTSPCTASSSHAYLRPVEHEKHVYASRKQAKLVMSHFSSASGRYEAKPALLRGAGAQLIDQDEVRRRGGACHAHAACLFSSSTLVRLRCDRCTAGASQHLLTTKVREEDISCKTDIQIQRRKAAAERRASLKNGRGRGRKRTARGRGRSAGAAATAAEAGAAAAPLPEALGE